MQKKKLLVSAIWAMCLHVEAQTLATDYKGASNGNPISPCVFCADPTAIEYEGRLYVYGTNDHQQYIKNGKTGSNNYGAIKSLVIFSTDDMVQTTVEVDPAVFKGEKSVYFVFTAADNVQFDAWQFAELGASGISSHSMTEPATHHERYSLDGRRLSDYHSTNGIVIEQYIDALGKKQVRKQLSY